MFTDRQSLMLKCLFLFHQNSPNLYGCFVWNWSMVGEKIIACFPAVFPSCQCNALRFCANESSNAQKALVSGFTSWDFSVSGTIWSKGTRWEPKAQKYHMVVVRFALSSRPLGNRQKMRHRERKSKKGFRGEDWRGEAGKEKWLCKIQGAAEEEEERAWR